MNFQQSIEKCFKNYANFNGRATRSEYWFFILFGILVSIGTVILDLLFFDNSGTYSPLNSIAAIALIIPQLSAGCRRLHDVGYSGWWQLLYITIWRHFCRSSVAARAEVKTRAPRWKAAKHSGTCRFQMHTRTP